MTYPAPIDVAALLARLEALEARVGRMEHDVMGTSDNARRLYRLELRTESLQVTTDAVHHALVGKAPTGLARRPRADVLDAGAEGMGRVLAFPPAASAATA